MKFKSTRALYFLLKKNGILIQGCHGVLLRPPCRRAGLSQECRQQQRRKADELGQVEEVLSHHGNDALRKRLEFSSDTEATQFF